MNEGERMEWNKSCLDVSLWKGESLYIQLSKEEFRQAPEETKHDVKSTPNN